MALPCYAHNLCLHRSLQNGYNGPYKAVILCNSWYLSKKEHSSRAKNSNSENSSGMNLNGDFQEKHVIPETVAKKEESTNYEGNLNALEEPTTCCMSGCANCVWIEYAEELSKRYKNGGEKAKEAIMKLSDPNMRAFLLTELKTSNNS